MLEFISEKNHLLHLEYHRGLLMRISAFERENTDYKGKDIFTRLRICAKRRDGESVARLYALAELHSVFFDSFTTETYHPSVKARECFGSDAALRDGMLRASMPLSHGFVAAVRGRGRIEIVGSEDPREIFARGVPLLALDLCEHAYYGDFGFDKESYLRSALPYLRMEKLDEQL